MRVRPNLTAFRMPCFGLRRPNMPIGRNYLGTCLYLLVFSHKRKGRGGHPEHMSRSARMPRHAPPYQFAGARVIESTIRPRAAVFTFFKRKRLKPHGFLRQGNASDIARRGNASQLPRL